MPDIRANGDTSNTVRFKLRKADTGQGLTGLTISSAGLIISTICDNEASATAYTQAGSTIETIATLGTFATPTATKCRFKECDSTNHPGLYEFQFANARFAVSNAKRLVITVSGATNLLEADYEIEFTPSVNAVGDFTTTMKTSLNAATPASLQSITAAQCNKIADHGRRRTQANVFASSDGDAVDEHSLYGFIQMSQKSSVSGTTLTILNPDGTTLGSLTLTTTSGANPVTGVTG